MNRAEKRRQKKLAKKAASNAKLGKATIPSPGQQTPTIQQSLELAVRHHNAGDLAKAEGLYQQVLQADPRQPAALHLLGVIAHQGEENDIAVDLITQALAIKPDLAEAHSNLGIALQDLGRLDEAVASYQKALSLKPDYAKAHNNLGNALQDMGRLDEAVASYHKALAIKPDYAEAHNNLGVALRELGKLDDAVFSFEKAIALNPDYAEAHNNLGNTLRELGKLDEAMASHHKALAIKPDYAEAHNNLGNALQDMGRLDEAMASHHKALAIKPDYAEAHNNLGVVLRELGKLDEAVASYQKALAINPEYTEAHSNLGIALQDLGRLDEAVVSYHKALAIKPDYAKAHSNLGNAFKNLGELDEAVVSYHKALAIKPDYAKAHSNLLFCMANSPDYGPEEILKEAKHWNKMHALPLGAEAVSHANDPNLERRLKIGYLSGDLRQHPVGFFMEAVFENHDKIVFEVHVFTTQHKADDVTDRIKDHVDQWHDAAHLNPQALAEAIREEGIDILTDLTGHAAFNGYLTLARRPAPVQILGVGNFCTSGLDCIDGLLSDRFETPEGTDGHYSEPLIRLPDDFICYRPPDYAADVGPSPCLNNGFITFGCFNNLAKISGPAIALWAEILKQVPESRLLLKTMALASERARARLKSLFTVHGVSEDRILLEPSLPHAPFMAEYGRVDIGLDPFPYSGGLTTIEALWMGVPVVTLSGETFAARHSTSHLNNSGLVELVCEDPVAYVSKVLEIAADFEALNALHLSIRPKLAASPILDSNRYTRNLERVFRQLWHEWCKKTSS